jgi:hypothetical protein
MLNDHLLLVSGGLSIVLTRVHYEDLPVLVAPEPIQIRQDAHHRIRLLMIVIRQIMVVIRLIMVVIRLIMVVIRLIMVVIRLIMEVIR